MTPNIIIYGRSDGSCYGCEMVKKLMKEYDLPYDFRDIGTEDKIARIQYKKELRANGVDRIPFLIINGEIKVIGFDENILREILDTELK